MVQLRVRRQLGPCIIQHRRLVQNLDKRARAWNRTSIWQWRGGGSLPVKGRCKLKVHGAIFCKGEGVNTLVDTLIEPSYLELNGIH